MTDRTALPERAGQANAPQEGARSHILVVFANDKHGAIDRVIGLLRRRRANAQKLAIGRSEVPDVVRITIVMDDSEVGVHQLAEQLRKVVDVQHVDYLSSKQTVARELALIKVNSSATASSEIIELGDLFGAHTVDIGQETVTLEVTGSEEKVEKLVSLLQGYGIRELARTGCVAMTRDM
jgi:acetolactate synthase-1/3 small subunit